MKYFVTGCFPNRSNDISFVFMHLKDEQKKENGQQKLDIYIFFNFNVFDYIRKDEM